MNPALVILSAEVTDSEVNAARELLERFAHTTTAIRALALALGELAGETTETELALHAFAKQLAEVEAKET